VNKLWVELITVSFYKVNASMWHLLFYFIGSYIKVFTSKLSGLSSDGANRHYVALFQRSVDE